MGIVYKATNLVNGKVYIGKTTLTLEQRRKKHQAVHRAPRQVFQKALVKYGFDAFQWCVLEEVGPEALDEAEMRWIAHYRATDPAVGYNRSVGGDGGRRGFKDTDAVRLKKAMGMLGNQNAKKREGSPRREFTPEHRAAISQAMKGRSIKRSQETKDAISQKLKGRTLSPEHRQKISDGVRKALTR